MNWQRVSRIGSLLLIAALFAVVLAYTDVEKVGRAFTGIKWGWAVCVPLLNFANTLVEALRLAVVLFPIKRHFRFRNTLNSTLLAIVGNVLLPLRFGDGARAWYLSKTEKMGLSSSLSALMLDRVADFFFFFVLMALTATLYQLPPSLEKAAVLAAALFVGAIALTVAVAGIGHRIGSRSEGRIRSKIALEVKHFMAGLSVMSNAGLMFPIGFCSVVSWLLRGGMIWVMFRAFSLDLPFIATPITLIILNFGIAVVSTPANLGGFELATVGALRLFGVEIEVALSYALALHVIEVAPMVGAGVAVLWFEGFKTGDMMKTVKDLPLKDVEAVPESWPQSAEDVKDSEQEEPGRFQ